MPLIEEFQMVTQNLPMDPLWGLVAIGISLGLFIMASRELFAWFFKINQIIAELRSLQRKIDELKLPQEGQPQSENMNVTKEPLLSGLRFLEINPLEKKSSQSLKWGKKKNTFPLQ